MLEHCSIPLAFRDRLQSDSDQLWIGSQCPFTIPNLQLTPESGYRADAKHHLKFKTVWLIEADLASYPVDTFELVLDEVVRLIDGDGFLFLRFSQNRNLSVISVKNFLGRKYGYRVFVDSEIRVGKEYWCCFSIQRENVERYRNRDWTFAVITQGVRRKSLQRFFESIRNSLNGQCHEILVCGPELEELGEHNLTYLTPYNFRDELAEICRKKNAILDQARGTNIVIAHDRYMLQPDFFDGFEKYGYDFDFVTIPQYYEDGAWFPSYCALSSDRLIWTRARDCRRFDFLLPSHYINGGLIIAKTATLRDLRFNELLFWDQAEDVELARVLRSVGLPPRFNPYSSALTIGITHAHTAKIIPLYSHRESRLKTLFRKLLRKILG